MSSSRPRIGELLLAAGAIDEEQLACALAEQAGLAYAPAPLPTPDPELLEGLDPKQLRNLGILPLGTSMTGTIRAAVSDPGAMAGQLLVSQTLGAALSLVVCAPGALESALRSAFASAPAADDDAEELDLIDGDDDAAESDDDDVEERIVEIAVTSSIPLRGALSPLSTVPPGAISAPGLRAPPVVHAAPPDDDPDVAGEPSGEPAPGDRPAPDESESLDEVVVQVAAASPAGVRVPGLAPPLTPPPIRSAGASPPAPPLPLRPPPKAWSQPPRVEHAEPEEGPDTLVSPPADSPSPNAALDEETHPAIGLRAGPGPMPALPPSLVAPGRNPPLLGDESAPPPGLDGPLVLDFDAEQGLAHVVKELRERPTPYGTLQLLAALLGRGLELRCDAVQFTSEEAHLRVDYRVDGVMQSAVRLPGWSRDATLDGLRRALGLSPAAPPAEGLDRGFEATWKGRPVRCRVTEVDPVADVRLTLRVRDSGAVREVDALGLPPEVRKRMRQWGAARQGLVLFVGPRDSGRSTTLRSFARAESRKRRTSVVGPWDLFASDGTETHRYGTGPREEDVAVATHAALVRDPDVLVIDGIEDVIGLAIRAADDGRLVVGGMVADDAADALGRLLERVSADVLGTQLVGIIEQRMVPGICPTCRATAPVDRGLARRLGLVLETMPTTLPARGPGCRSCRHSGVRGRHVLFTRVELAGLPPGLSREARRLSLLAESNRPQSPAEAGLALVVQGKTSLQALGRSLGAEAGRVIVTSPDWGGVVEETQEGPRPTLGDGDENTEASEPRMLPDLLGEASEPSGEFTGTLSQGVDGASSPRLLLVIGGDGLDDRLRKALPADEYRVASVADVAAAQSFVSRSAPRAILLSVAGDVAGSVAQIGVLRGDLQSAFLPVVAVGASDEQAATLIRAGADETLAGDLKGRALESSVRRAIQRAT